jgi:hypothetical protein
MHCVFDNALCTKGRTCHMECCFCPECKIVEVTITGRLRDRLLANAACRLRGKLLANATFGLRHWLFANITCGLREMGCLQILRLQFACSL